MKTKFVRNSVNGFLVRVSESFDRDGFQEVLATEKKKPLSPVFLPGELWKDFPLGNSYKISNKGRVLGLAGKILKPFTNDKGYLEIGLNFEGKRKNFKIHRLVAITFLPNPRELRCVNHIDGSRKNNELENLEWCSHAENTQHAIKVLGVKMGPKGPRKRK